MFMVVHILSGVIDLQIFGVPAQEIIHSDVVIVGQDDQMSQWNLTFSCLIVAINSLVNPQETGHLSLCHISVLTQIAQPRQIHILHLDCILIYYQIIVFTLLSKNSKLSS